MAKQPHWIKPPFKIDPSDPIPPFPKLFLNNSLTRQKEQFIPRSGSTHVTWYNCGPTVYDASHMGHARTYITFDILRRVLEDYFQFRVQFIMNITDIDDKIIVRARQSYLFKEFKQQCKPEDVFPVLAGGVELIRAKLKVDGDQVIQSHSDIHGLLDYVGKNTDTLSADVGEKFSLYFGMLKKASEASDMLSSSPTLSPEMFELIEDVVSPYLDSLKGSSVTDLEIFTNLTEFWEGEFLKDMESLNIRPPTILTRVTQYVPEIIDFVEKIIANGYAYTTADGSVYFDVDAFKGKKSKTGTPHCYAKLVPSAAGNSQLVAEGEGSLASGAGISSKKNPNDFALWKSSKSGEPFWESPWGKGRPGWHIECSAMAGSIFGEQMDIHSGGIDLRFPHHDNELAQSEGCFECDQWVNYFLHSGHLHIEGQKMSKSLKNFVTIREALSEYTSNQVRMMFLMHQWDSILDYKTSSMRAAITAETTFRNFIQNARAMHRLANFAQKQAFGLPETDVYREFQERQERIHLALVDNINTPVVIQEMLGLCNRVNAYQKNREDAKAPVSNSVLTAVSEYLERMLKMFGMVDLVVDGPQSSSAASQAGMSYLEALAGFRGRIRDLARSNSEFALKDILVECDKIRDEVLPKLGVIFEDKEDQTLVKFGSAEEIEAQIATKKKAQEEKERQKLAKKTEEERRKQERLTKGKIAPGEMFKTGDQAKEFSQWDEKGIPTHDAEGAELAKSRRKKLAKEHQSQEKLHAEYLKSVQED